MTRSLYLHFIDPLAAVAVYIRAHTQTNTLPYTSLTACALIVSLLLWQPQKLDNSEQFYRYHPCNSCTKGVLDLYMYYWRVQSEEYIQLHDMNTYRLEAVIQPIYNWVVVNTLWSLHALVTFCVLHVLALDKPHSQPSSNVVGSFSESDWIVKNWSSQCDPSVSQQWSIKEWLI